MAEYLSSGGGETDLNLGNYERYLDIGLTHTNNITTGKIYKHVFVRKGKGGYLGRAVQVVPHITHAIADQMDMMRVCHSLKLCAN